MKNTRIKFTILSLLLICTIMLNITACSMKVQAADLMDGVKANTVSGEEVDEKFINSQMKLYVDLFKSSFNKSENENMLVSPLSVQLALAMTANGANGQTKEEMEKLLGGELSIEKLNKYLYTYVNSLPSEEKCKLEIANSIWFRDDEKLTVNKDFLQTNADYYDAQAYKSPFDETTVKDINNWVKTHTDEMIKEIIDKINEETIMFLINALVFDADWESPYLKENIINDIFTTISGEEQTVEMMCSEEHIYLDDGRATGFIKDYKDSKYSFVALLPNEDISISEYVKSLSYDNLSNTIKNAERNNVKAFLPKFSYEYSLTMNDILANLGMSSAFDMGKADFSKLGKSNGNIYIGQVLHKTFISVDEVGTEAAAVTSVQANCTSAILNQYVVKLDRPFVYMILDNSTNLPIFMGTVMGID